MQIKRPCGFNKVPFGNSTDNQVALVLSFMSSASDKNKQSNRSDFLTNPKKTM